MSEAATPTTTSHELPDLIAVNLHDRQGMWSDGTFSPLTLHDEDGDEVDDPEDAVFLTTPTPDGKWAAAQVADYVHDRTVH